jgi:hypothetical protein
MILRPPLCYFNERCSEGHPPILADDGITSVRRLLGRPSVISQRVTRHCL